MKSHQNTTEEDILENGHEKLDIPVTFKISQELHTKLLIKCKEIKRNKSDTVRLAIEEFVNQTDSS